MKARLVALLVACALLVGGGLGWRALVRARSGRPPNVILICVDGCRADHLGAWGYGRDTTPTLDRLARQGLSFTRNYSQANESLFSHASLFTSRHPSEIALPTYTHFAIPSALPTLAKRLKMLGYQTAGFTGGGHVRHEYGFGDGYDRYFDDVPFGSFFMSVPQAMHWLENKREGPFFMFLHGYDCHRPYRKPAVFSHLYAPGYQGDADRYLASPQVLDRVFEGRFFESFDIRQSRTRAGDRPSDPTSYLELARLAQEHPEAGKALASGDVEHIIAHYDAAITYSDTWIGTFLAGMDRLGLDRTNTLVVVLADHGEDLMEHGMFNHRFGLHVPNLHVPLIFWGAGVDARQAGRRLDRVTQKSRRGSHHPCHGGGSPASRKSRRRPVAPASWRGGRGSGAPGLRRGHPGHDHGARRGVPGHRAWGGSGHCGHGGTYRARAALRRHAVPV